jgi:prefoldin alpha subunit
VKKVVNEMSDQGRDVQVSLEDLLAQADYLKRYIDVLQKSIADLTDSLNSIESAKQFLEMINEKQEQLVSVDRKGFVLVKSEIKDTSKVTMNIGLGYYAEVTPEQAKKMLDSRKDELNKALQGVLSEREKAATAYYQIAEILERAQAEQPR